ncbi:MAG: T9SS type A sorting domain-containing protein, partial [bacterium]|nr:T9SS type A sorting domain-containing protein [bacterium]
PVLITGDEILKYIDDGCYVPVDHYEHPAIILWPADHSGITTEDPNIIISKWGSEGPLVKHATNVGEWMHYELEDIGTKVQYYIIPNFCEEYYPSYTYSISGQSNEYVKEAEYSVNIRDYDEVEWHYSSNLEKVGGSSKTINLSTNCNSNLSMGWVSATVYHAPNSQKCANVVEIPRTYVFTGKPQFSYDDFTFTNTFGSPANYLCNSHTGNYYQIDNKYDATRFKVQICRLNGQVLYEYTTSSTSRSLNYTNLNGYYLFRICGMNDCSSPYYGDWYESEIEFRNCTSGGGGETGDHGDYGESCVSEADAEDLFFGPNPADDKTTITINDDSDIHNKNINGNDSWSIEIYNELGILVKKQVNLSGNEHTINTTDLKKGIYIVIARFKNEVKKSKLLIER